MRAGVYVLQLQNGGYYVGKSDNIDARVQQHTTGVGSAWCRHKGGCVKEVPTVFAGSLEDTASWEMNETVTQMLLHGYENVRGWEFSSCGALTSGELDTIKNVIMGQTDMCRKCGNGGHFAQGCNSSTVKAKWLLDLENLKIQTLSAAPSAMAMAAMSYESGEKKAFFSSNAAGGSGSALKGSAGDGSGNKGQGGISGKGGWGQGGRCGRGGRGSGFSVRGGGVVKRSISRSALFCKRCGRGTHMAANCYARCGVDGKKLDDYEDDDDDDDDKDDEDDDNDNNDDDDEFSGEY